MAGCRHTDWVEISRTPRHLRLSDPGRLGRLVRELGRPAQQYPQIVLCIGKEEKRKLIAQILLDQSVTRSSSKGTLSPNGLSGIFSDKSQVDVDRPMFFANCHLDGTIPDSRQFKCHETKSSHNAWPLSCRRVYDSILTSLLFPFSNLVCLFAEDLGGVDTVLDKVESWSATERQTDLADFARRALPRVCVIASGPPDDRAQVQQEAWNSRLQRLDYGNHFSSVQVLRFNKDSIQDFHRNFRLLLLDELEISCAMKQRHRVRFNAEHLSGFFSRAISHLAADPGERFSFISASRTFRPVPPAYPKQISGLLRSRAQQGVGLDQVFTLIASCLLLDAYPRGSHGECDTDGADSVHGRQLWLT